MQPAVSGVAVARAGGSVAAMRTATVIIGGVALVVVLAAVAIVRPAAAPPPPSSAAEAVVPAHVRMLCLNCHRVDGHGGTQGPSLDGVGARLSAEQIARWIADPQAVKPGTAMPRLGLSAEEQRAVVAWLAARR